jgi:4'-phosphopantetheinyl transferase
MEASWLEQTVADVPAANDWLSSRDESLLSAMRIPKRRADWRLGRWTAKHAVAAHLGLAFDPRTLATIEIRPADSGAPEVYLESGLANVSISLTHRAGIGACAVAPAGMTLGCDLEIVEPRTDAFVEDYFTADEQAMLQGKPAAERHRILAVLWSAKETALKVLRTGLRLDTRCVAITFCHDLVYMDQELPESAPGSPFTAPRFSVQDWRPFRACHAGDRVFYGWWQACDDIVRTIAAEQSMGPPRVVLARR